MFPLIIYNIKRGRTSLNIEIYSEWHYNDLTLRPHVDRELNVKGFQFLQGIMSERKTQCTPIVRITIPFLLTRNERFHCLCNECFQDRWHLFSLRQYVYWKRSATLMKIVSGFYSFFFILIAHSVFNLSKFDILWICAWHSMHKINHHCERYINPLKYVTMSLGLLSQYLTFIIWIGQHN